MEIERYDNVFNFTNITKGSTQDELLAIFMRRVRGSIPGVQCCRKDRIYGRWTNAPISRFEWSDIVCPLITYIDCYILRFVVNILIYPNLGM